MPQDRVIEDADASKAHLSAQMAERPIVAFDFDGTLTVKDSYTAFLRWWAGPIRYALGMVRLTPAALSYLVHKDRGRIKAAATAEFLKGVNRARLELQAARFASTYSRTMLRPDAVAAWRRWRTQPVRLVIVTASPDVVVGPFARGLGADVLIGTQLEFDADGRATGRFSTPNCRGPEKVARLNAVFGEGIEIRAAYGDTAGDHEMLAAATETAGYRVFRGTPGPLKQKRSRKRDRS